MCTRGEGREKTIDRDQRPGVLVHLVLELQVQGSHVTVELLELGLEALKQGIEILAGHELRQAEPGKIGRLPVACLPQGGHLAHPILEAHFLTGAELGMHLADDAHNVLLAKKHLASFPAERLARCEHQTTKNKNTNEIRSAHDFLQIRT